MDTNIVQESDDSLVDVNKDPAIDPLFINNCEERDADTTLMDSKSQSSKLKHKLNTEEKHLLKELEDLEGWEDLPSSLMKKLRSLCIKLMHKVPPQHKIELTGSHAPTRLEKKLFEKYGPLRKGLYTPVEDKIITKNWETFCQVYFKRR
ncbi:hypothetical protein RF55_933 [Lasius niger]|uniref:Uncharacterized protein n=1 Tax=Lasius niger TaxID=67767 RepID=A0A0J7L891_LASNI|nr:hypothetical protein RF55_933 [Lasius niger]